MQSVSALKSNIQSPSQSELRDNEAPSSSKKAVKFLENLKQKISST